jgi:hypothetical protein
MKTIEKPEQTKASKVKPIAGPKHDEDLRRNPGIGQSPGTFATGEDLEELEGDSTFEGDVENDTGLGDGVGPEPKRQH